MSLISIKGLSLFLDINHWIIQRITVSSFILYSFYSCISNITYSLNILICIISLHLFLGINVLVDDYIHDSLLYSYGIVLIRTFVILLLKSILTFII